jgi:hypothetical protein
MDKALLDLYTDYLLSSFHSTTATGLSRLVDGAVSHDQVTRFLSGPKRTSADLWRLVKPPVRKVQSPSGVLIVDDSIEEKPYTDPSDLVCSHWDHSKSRYVRGINFLTVLYHVEADGKEGREWSLPVAFDLVTKTETVIDKKTGKEKKKSRVTKNERYRDLLRACVENEIPFAYVLNDVWFASAENMQFVKGELGKEFVMPLKSNRKVALSSEDKARGRYVTVDALDLEGKAVREIYLEGVSFPLSLIRQVFTNEDGSRGLLYLVTSDTRLSHERITAIYQRRWKVETYHQSLKQNASLAKSPTKTETTQTNHFFASLYAFVKLETLKQTTSLNHYALKTKLYVSALQSAFRELQRLQNTNSYLATA